KTSSLCVGAQRVGLRTTFPLFVFRILSFLLNWTIEPLTIGDPCSQLRTRQAERGLSKPGRRRSLSPVAPARRTQAPRFKPWLICATSFANAGPIGSGPRRSWPTWQRCWTARGRNGPAESPLLKDSLRVCLGPSAFSQERSVLAKRRRRDTCSRTSKTRLSDTCPPIRN